MASALLNRRNAELHSGAAAFAEYRPSQWLAGFYHACKSLTTALEETLADLFGEAEAKFAEEMLAENREKFRRDVLGAIAAHKKVFEAEDQNQEEAARADADGVGLELCKAVPLQRSM